MTLFEYLSVLVSIVLSFGIVRLLDGVPFALARERRYMIHGAWVGLTLWLHVHVWWVLWSYSGSVAWNYPRFLIVLADPLLLYSLAITLVPRDPATVESWRDRFYELRVRFFLVLAAWMFVVALANWLVLEQPLLSRFRLGHVAFIGLCLVGALSRRPRVQGVLVFVTAAMVVLFVSSTFFEPAALLR
jgi:hypothetical protein